MNDKATDLIKVMDEFIVNTIYGHESGFYKAFFMNRDILKMDNMRNMIDIASANYLNQAFRALIKDDDEYFVKYFHKMNSFMNHSYICLLNITYVFLTMIHNKLDRTTFDTTDYQKYMESVVKERDKVISMVKSDIVKSISHVCTGEDIKKCNPDEDLFVIQKS